MQLTSLSDQKLEEEAWKLSQNLKSTVRRWRMAAEQELKERADEFLEPLLIIYARTNTVKLGKKKKKLSIFVWILVVIILVTITEHGKFFSFPNFDTSSFIDGGLSGILPLLFIEFFRKRTGVDKGVLTALATYRDCRIVGPMAEALWIDHPEKKLNRFTRTTEYETALIESLSMVNSEKDIQLTEFELGCLHKALGVNRPGLNIAILQAIPYFGNEQSLQIVRKAAKGSSWRQEKVVRAAQESLPELEKRAERLKAEETLLRPSSAAEVTSETLLRSSFPSDDAAPNELLRAAAGD